ncbi:hypothetical protein EDC94DRAFT_582138 [Helicostylum pulchrum]|nr:hypothetical protein EDC94DRAFT_582138 [Helicostylum pulchrum]
MTCLLLVPVFTVRVLLFIIEEKKKYFLMNVSNVKAFVWTLPNPELLSERNEHDHSNCIFTKQLDNDEAAISTIIITHFMYKDFDGRERGWIVDKCIQDKDTDSNPAQEERKKIIKLALKGQVPL